MRGSGIRDIVATELWLREPLDSSRLNGRGIRVINPPYRFEAEAPRSWPHSLPGSVPENPV
jgi:23S rRNA (adenine2030-N6)-methyltransferase